MTLWVESRRAGRGEQAAFELLWERHRDATYAAVVRVVGRNRALADDVFQDVWLEVTRATRYEPGSFRSYVRTIATRKALDRMQTAAVRLAAREDPESDGDPFSAMASPAPGPGRSAAGRESASRILAIAEGMPPEQRVAWKLRYVEQMTFEEVAETMGTPVGTAKTRVRIANAFLAEALREQGVEAAELEVEG